MGWDRAPGSASWRSRDAAGLEHHAGQGEPGHRREPDDGRGRVVGNDATIAFGQTGSFLELNVMLPVTAAALLDSIALLAAATNNFSHGRSRA